MIVALRTSHSRGAASQASRKVSFDSKADSRSGKIAAENIEAA